MRGFVPRSRYITADVTSIEAEIEGAPGCARVVSCLDRGFMAAQVTSTEAEIDPHWPASGCGIALATEARRLHAARTHDVWCLV